MTTSDDPTGATAMETAGTLYIVATPIGNLDDMVPRAIEALQQAHLIAAEDTRHSQRLLEHFHISTPCEPYHDHNEQQKTQRLLECLSRGQRVALISDAGTPLVSDPGYRLVRAAHQAGVAVVPIPGACAAIAALSAAGLPSDRFCFEGFLPAKTHARQKALSALASETRTLIFYEAPHRLQACLTDLAATLGDEREVVLARELTKTFETIKSATAAQLRDWVAADANQRKGEIVLVVRGAPARAASEVDERALHVVTLLAAELPPKRAAALAAEVTGADKKQLYQALINQS